MPGELPGSTKAIRSTDPSTLGVKLDVPGANFDKQPTEPRDIFSKFVYDEKSVTLAYGEVSTFFKGLGAFLGTPSSSVIEGMKFEHCDNADSTAKFKPPNFGTETCSKCEWYFVKDPMDGLRELTQNGIMSWPSARPREGAHTSLNLSDRH